MDDLPYYGPAPEAWSGSLCCKFIRSALPKGQPYSWQNRIYDESKKYMVSR